MLLTLSGLTLKETHARLYAGCECVGDREPEDAEQYVLPDQLLAIIESLEGFWSLSDDAAVELDLTLELWKLFDSELDDVISCFASNRDYFTDTDKQIAAEYRRGLRVLKGDAKKIEDLLATCDEMTAKQLHERSPR